MTEADLARLLRANPDLCIEGLDIAPAKAQPKRPVVRQRSLLTEHDMQASVIAECDLRANQDPVWQRIFAVPNGQYRPGERMEPGLRKGVLDLQWPFHRGGYVGLVMELKVGDNMPTAEQEDWLAWYAAEGWFTCVVYDVAAEAMRILEWYYNGANP